MNEINLYPSMNKQIVDILRLGGDEEDNQAQMYAAALIEYLQKENNSLRSERDAAEEDFIDYVTNRTGNFAPYCKNACPECTDKRGWCILDKCKGRKWRGVEIDKEGE